MICGPFAIIIFLAVASSLDSLSDSDTFCNWVRRLLLNSFMAGNLGETVMADAKISIAKTLVNEGGYVDNPNDSGGPTKYGITQRDLPGEDIEKLTPERATAYYLENYWKALYSQIDSQAVADKIFDMGVLFGVGTAIKLLQNILASNRLTAIFGEHTL